MSSESLSLPLVRGKYSYEVNLGKHTWFRVGGPAQVLFKPADREDLQNFIRNNRFPIFVLGMGSNLIVRDQGIKGVVLRLTRGFSEITIEGDELIVGAGALDRTVAFTSAEHGLSGLEFLAGIPGCIGGAVKMNAGAYGTEVKDVLIYADVIDTHGNLHRLSCSDMGFEYRHSALPKDWIVVGARFRALERKPTALILKTIHSFLQQREQSQPVHSRTGGSTFKNPPMKKAWQLIDAAGCRGLKVGDAQISELHCNFMLNLGAATAADLEQLGEQVRKQVYENSGVNLEWEIIRI